MKNEFEVTCNYYKSSFGSRKSSHSQIIEAEDLYEASDIYADYHEVAGTFKRFNVVSYSVKQLTKKE